MLTGRPFITFPLTGPNDPGIAVVNLQFKMYEYHAGLTATHTFESPWWSWSLMVNPMGNVATKGLPAYVPLWLDVTYSLPNNLISTITVMGNPAVWWVGFFLMLVLTERAIRGSELVHGLRNKLSRKPKTAEPQVAVTSDGSTHEPSYSNLPLTDLESTQASPITKAAATATSAQDTAVPFVQTAEVPPLKSSGRKWDIAAIFIVVVFFFSWIPYNLISRVTFIYHFYICVPFICFASAYFIDKYWNRRVGKIVTVIFFVAVVAYVHCLLSSDLRYANLNIVHSSLEMVPKLVLLAMMTSQNSANGLVQVSVVFPAYNEAAYLDTAVEKTTQALKEFTSSYEIIIAEDGSKDGTAEHAEELAQKLPYVKHIHGEERLGRGKALNNAFRQSRGEVFVYMDLDLATDLRYLKPLVEAITVEGYDFATGSRMLPESKVERSMRRTISSKSFNFLVRSMLGSKLRDHQCGFKAFKREPSFAANRRGRRSSLVLGHRNPRSCPT